MQCNEFAALHSLMQTGKASGDVGTRLCYHKFMKTRIEDNFAGAGKKMAYFTNKASAAADHNQNMKPGGCVITETKPG